MKSVPKPRGTRRVQYAALPYRQRQDGEIQIRLITSRETRRWVIPKGWPMKGLSPSKAAAREAYEEAGLLGSISSEPLGLYSYDKRLTLQTVPCDVMVFPLKVKRYVKKWPERSERFGFWFSVESAAAAVQEEDLRLIILAFGDQMAARFAEKRSRNPEAELAAPADLSEAAAGMPAAKARPAAKAKTAAKDKPAAKDKAAAKDKPAIAAKAKAPAKPKAPSKAEALPKAKDMVADPLIAGAADGEAGAAPLAEVARGPVKGKSAAKPKAKAKAAAKPKAAAKSKLAAKSADKSAAKSEAKPKGEAKAKAEAKPKALGKPKAAAKPKQKPASENIAEAGNIAAVEAGKPAKGKLKSPPKAKGQRVVLAETPEADWAEDEASARLPVLPGMSVPSTRH